jgi:hypothetical protein
MKITPSVCSIPRKEARRPGVISPVARNIVLTVCLANLRELKRAAYLASRYLTLNCVDAMFVRATVL